MSPEELARLFHETYEELAPQFGYETREASRKPWSDVPENNKKLMIAVAEKVLVVQKKRTAEDCIEDCAVVDENKWLKEALEQIRDLETEVCHRCEGNGRLYADGKVHFLHEDAPTILCGNCGGSGQILPEDAQEIAAQALKGSGE